MKVCLSPINLCDQCLAHGVDSKETMETYFKLLPKSSGPMWVNIFVPTMVSLLLSSSSSVNPNASVTFLIPVGTFNGTQILIFATGSLKTDPLNPPIIRTFPCKFARGSFDEAEEKVSTGWEEEGDLEVFALCGTRGGVEGGEESWSESKSDSGGVQGFEVEIAEVFDFEEEEK